MIHSTMPYSHIVNVASTLFLPVKRVWFQHGPVGGALDKFAGLLPVDLVIFNSVFIQREHLKTTFSFSRHKELVLKLGIDVSDVNEKDVKYIRDKYLGVDNILLLVSAGRITEWKGLDVQIRAIGKLKRNHPDLFQNSASHHWKFTEAV